VGGKGILKVLRQLSRESGIPIGTLTDWLYPEIQLRYQKSVIKNDNTIFKGLTEQEQVQIVDDAKNQMLNKAKDNLKNQTSSEISNDNKENESQEEQPICPVVLKISCVSWIGL